MSVASCVSLCVACVSLSVSLVVKHEAPRFSCCFLWKTHRSFISFLDDLLYVCLGCRLVLDGRHYPPVLCPRCVQRSVSEPRTIWTDSNVKDLLTQSKVHTLKASSCAERRHVTYLVVVLVVACLTSHVSHVKQYCILKSTEPLNPHTLSGLLIG